MVKGKIQDYMLTVLSMGNGIIGTKVVKKKRLVFIKMAKKMVCGEVGILMGITFLSGIIVLVKKMESGFGGMIAKS